MEIPLPDNEIPTLGSVYQCGFEEKALNGTKLGFGQGSILIYRIISIIGIIMNILFLISSFFQIFGKNQKKREKISSMEKLFVAISGTEICISILWLLNTIYYESPYLIYHNCDSCLITGMITIFFYIFDWIILGITINQFNLLMLNPLDATPTKKLIKYFLIAFAFSLLTSVLSQIGHINGLSVRILNINCYIANVNMLYESKYCFCI